MPNINRNICIFAVTYILISQLFLPIFEKKDFFIFFTWSLFTGKVEKTIYDYTWDHGKTFIFRDHQSLLKEKTTRAFRKRFFKATKKGRIEHLKTKYGAFFKKIQPKEDIYLYKLQNTLKEHIILKSNLDILKKIRMSNHGQNP